MVKEERIREEFQTLVAFDSESFAEGDIKDYLKDKLTALGLTVHEDDVGTKLGHDNPKSAGNLYAFLPGSTDGDALLFSAHMDTVRPGKNKKAIFEADGTVHSDGTTVLGADDVSGIVSILEALTVIRERNLPHPDIEILFSVAEEPYGKGAALFDYRKIHAKTAYVLDLTGSIGTAATRAPSILSVEVEITGKAAHAGFAPEEGINALSVAADALSDIPTGHIGNDTTVNFGQISGGSGKNIVPASIHIGGEIRSLRHEAALAAAQNLRDVFEKAAAKRHAAVQVTVTEDIHAYEIADDEPVVRRFAKALASLDYGKPKLITTFGGSDNNTLNLHGIRGIVVADAMENVHTVNEYTTLSDLIKSARLTVALMTL
ncbi:MAG: M20/M25/M40 family metallo-hydrolase [Eubacteriales bacterium]